MTRYIIVLTLSLIALASVSQIPAYGAHYTKDAPPGYYLLSVHTPGDTAWIIILDNLGNTVYYKTFPQVPINFNFALWPDGRMSFCGPFKYYFMDSTFRIVDSITCKNNYEVDLHEFQELPNGHFLLLGTEVIKADLSHFTWKGGNGSSEATVKCGIIQEQDADRNVVFEWHAKDYFAFADVDSFFLKGNKSNVDLMHLNAVEEDKDGNILLCARNYNEITKIDRQTGNVIWRFGGGRNQFKFINCTVPFYGQHDIRRLKNGNITLFEGGEHTTHHPARALEFKMDELNKTATLVWSYIFDTTTYSVARGGNVQQFADGKKLINYGDVKGKNICFLVLDSTDKEVFQLKFADALGSYRALNYANLPWQLHRPQISCFDSLGVTYLDAGAGHKSWKWNTGETSRIIKATSTGTYSVFVPCGEGGFICSERFDLSDCKKTTGLKNKRDKK
jgi:hypothetical protein